MRRMLAAAALLLSATSLHAQPLRLSEQTSIAQVEASTVDCEDGLKYDDGTFEDGYGFQDSVLGGRYVMRFQPPAGRYRIKAICTCWQAILNASHDYALTLYPATGSGGGPGTPLVQLPTGLTSGQTVSPKWHRVEVPNEVIVPEGGFYLGPAWFPFLDPDIFLCADENGPGGQPAYVSASLSQVPTAPLSITTPTYRALGIRVELEQISDPDPPAGAWITTAELPGYQFKARITAGSNVITPANEPCQEDTLCLSGALPGRSELYARIIGPRPNGFLWVNLVRFTTSQVEVWVQRTSDGELKYYKLPAILGDSSDLSGLVDKTAFQP